MARKSKKAPAKKRAKVLGRGAAGRQGDKVRSDLYVVFERTAEGGIEIELSSKVGLYYGDAIETQARETLAGLGIEHGRLTIEDKGALPFVITGRIEAAVRRSGAETKDLGNGKRKAPKASAADRLRRSRLYLPGNEPKFMTNAGLHGPDGIILDLEDSVHPDEKDAARVLVKSALRALSFEGAERMVRINQLPLGLTDLEDIVLADPELILIPKVEEASEIEAVDAKITEIQAARGRTRPLWLMPILESALGIENAFAIASASERVIALTIGLEDYTADLGVVKTKDGGESHYARCRMVNAAKAAGCQAIDSVYGDVGDMEGLRNWALRSRSLGFEGMGCIHPRQIPVLHEAYAPTKVEIDKALRIVAAFRAAEAQGLGVVSLGSKMVDPPVVNRALKLVAQAKAMGLVSKEDEA